jgi:hypothetical protein
VQPKLLERSIASSNYGTGWRHAHIDDHDQPCKCTASPFWVRQFRYGCSPARDVPPRRPLTQGNLEKATFDKVQAQCQ